LSNVQVGSSLREGLLLGVVEHLLSIDADIKWQEIVDAPTGGRGSTAVEAAAAAATAH
jgi:RNA polymerase I-specific transcription initiation factor RRN3